MIDTERLERWQGQDMLINQNEAPTMEIPGSKYNIAIMRPNNLMAFLSV